jgi:hypothetical protein
MIVSLFVISKVTNTYRSLRRRTPAWKEIESLVARTFCSPEEVQRVPGLLRREIQPRDALRFSRATFTD